MPKSTNNLCACQGLQQMISDHTLYYRTNSEIGWLISQVNEGTGINNKPKHKDYSDTKICPFCDREISRDNW